MKRHDYITLLLARKRDTVGVGNELRAAFMAKRVPSERKAAATRLSREIAK